MPPCEMLLLRLIMILAPLYSSYWFLISFSLSSLKKDCFFSFLYSLLSSFWEFLGTPFSLFCFIFSLGGWAKYQKYTAARRRRRESSMSGNHRGGGAMAGLIVVLLTVYFTTFSYGSPTILSVSLSFLSFSLDFACLV